MFHYEQKNAFLIMKIKALQKQHLMISNTVQKLNIIFSSYLLATIVLNFSVAILGLYFSFNIIQWYNGFMDMKEEINNMFLIGTTYSIIKLTLLVWACETGKNQAQEIRTTIHDVLNSSRDEQIKNELQLFSLQLLHSKDTYSAKAFNVDATFLAAMVGTITTYMLIVLQFLKISQSCDEKYAINIT
ncbi:PREDICTED: putative gustatory receptor 28b [Vollenhovia emeryi]|uniref:putative gustatory receptor 28b n=1 Tax=Vollenhovia emeryi TaxID=411798 RepID=UPI0005F585DB|nr:PREDICTED: putative gustatory receptor 28b [Vollenhovia emeryi]